MEQTDILEVTTGNPSKNKPAIEEARKEKEKEEQMQNIRSQEVCEKKSRKFCWYDQFLVDC